MDVNSARYLVSALIQATAAAWAVILAVHFFFAKRFIGWMPTLQRTPNHLSRKEQEEWLDERIEKTRKWAYGYCLNFMYLIGLSLLALLAIGSGIFALGMLDAQTYPDLQIALTVVFSASFFTLLFLLIWSLVYGAYVEARDWGKRTLGYYNQERKKLEKDE